MNRLTLLRILTIALAFVMVASACGQAAEPAEPAEPAGAEPAEPAEPAATAAPAATTSSGFTPLCGSRPKNSLTIS